ncbi:lipid-binding protein [Mucilaginibacter litoreus]|uniref:Lipid-binding protein n=1 Tax=Mucilaginibacter litoreus TaxID=1048221 RepID=A0ABW3ANV7_9SPHI
MKIKKYINYVSLAALLIPVLSACNKIPEREGTTVEKMAGEWYVRIDDKPKRYIMTTYNTSTNSADEFWVQTSNLRDLDVGPNENINIKGKVPVQLSAQTFAGTGLTNILAATATAIPKFEVANGKVITNGTVGVASRSPADSIYFELKVKGKTFKISGFHRTGFQADEPQ